MCGFFLSSYKGIIRRGYLVELKKVIEHCTFVTVGMIVWMFTVQESESYSRVVVFFLYPASIFLIWLGRLFWKRIIRIQLINRKICRKLLVITTRDNVNTTLNNLQQPYRDYMISGIIFCDDAKIGQRKIKGVPVVANNESMLDYIQASVVDEIFLDINENPEKEKQLTDFLSAWALQYMLI